MNELIKITYNNDRPAVSARDLHDFLEVKTAYKDWFPRWLRENGYLIKREGTDFNMPTQRSMELGLFSIKETAISRSNGTVSISKTVKVTGKGQQYFVEKFLGQSA